MQWLAASGADGAWLTALLALKSGDWHRWINEELGGIKGAELVNWCEEQRIV